MNSCGLKKIFDKHMSSMSPPFERHEIVVGGEAFEVYYHVLACALMRRDGNVCTPGGYFFTFADA